ncbi:MAG: alkaline phosphatase D family protein [Cyclobacteriaceae bacterium]|nr:alkaline phosphatase D family protein [Cyclobacteriaceae bacterium]
MNILKETTLYNDWLIPRLKIVILGKIVISCTKHNRLFTNGKILSIIFAAMNYLKILLAVFLSSMAAAQSPNETVIAFGSCNDEELPQEMWKEIIAQNPSLWIWGGDNVYAKDGEDAADLKGRYDKQKSNVDYQQLLKNCTITGTWDDHDYGANDGGRFFSKKQENKKPLLDFFGFAKKNPVWSHAGVYNSTTVGSTHQKIKIINLDTRTFRDTTYKVYSVDSLTKKQTYNFYCNQTGDVLGEEQWHWLEDELRTNNIGLFIINSSIQFIAEEHRFEKWGNFPAARQRLISLIGSSQRNVLIISGDRHIAEFSRLEVSGLPYPLIDFTSSGLTHTWSEVWEERNRHRVGDLVIQKTYGLIKLLPASSR